MTLKNKPLVIGIIIISMIIISNIPIVSFVLGFISQDRTLYGFDFYYTSDKGGFSNRGLFIEDHQDLLAAFSKYKLENPTDTILYRTFKINPLKFWFWREYLFDPKYNLPYKEPPVIINELNK